MKFLELGKLNNQSGVPGLNRNDLYEIHIPLPPLSIQQQIVDEISGYQKVIDGCRLLVEHYRPVVAVEEGWERVKLQEIAHEIRSGYSSGVSNLDRHGVPHLRPMNISTDGLLVWEGTKYIDFELFNAKIDYSLQHGDILFNNTNSKELVGKTCFIDKDIQCGFSNHMTRLRIKPEMAEPKFIALIIHQSWREGYFQELSNKWIGQAGIGINTLGNTIIPLPDLPTQRRIVAALETELAVIEGVRQLQATMEARVRAVIGRVWGDAHQKNTPTA